MGRKPAQQQLAETLRRMLDEGEFGFKELVAASAVGNGTLGRILQEDGEGRLAGENVRLATLDKLAESLGVQPWQLLHPDGELAGFSNVAIRIARAMDDLAPEYRERAYALFVQQVDFANVPKAADAASAPVVKPPRKLRRVDR
jgi:DNA-binding Xre family transcriptional regulator